eukprot:CAMPEP_0117419542 /NCGR_PEP_ID=MMETSP0758-20121206/1078_1 /TAXON_ID=63605 /ORGANISM="Percolomonas cosmopolitus, Strain AE-1 (ATCC 50343)" /LENGTH=244 /DNA_ID=CAMNT_0005200659 /DNA_START=1558 /DNA_END=2288 /DNA_ORIENTATION=-
MKKEVIRLQYTTYLLEQAKQEIHQIRQSRFKTESELDTQVEQSLAYKQKQNDVIKEIRENINLQDGIIIDISKKIDHVEKESNTFRTAAKENAKELEEHIDSVKKVLKNTQLDVKSNEDSLAELEANYEPSVEKLNTLLENRKEQLKTTSQVRDEKQKAIKKLKSMIAKYKTKVSVKESDAIEEQFAKEQKDMEVQKLLDTPKSLLPKDGLDFQSLLKLDIGGVNLNEKMDTHSPLLQGLSTNS